VSAPVYVGTSGWSYLAWRDSFYRGVPKREWLAWCARRFTAVEINASFYRLQSPQTFTRWRQVTPAGFRFALKANRYLTHNKKLADAVHSIALERGRAQALGDKLVAVLWQLPGNYKKHMGRLDGFLHALEGWPEVRHVLEFRHRSWFVDEVADSLSRHRVAVCQSDAADWPLWDRVTTDLVYVRLHGHTRTYASAYSRAALRRWAQRVRDWSEEGRSVCVFFDNDAEGAAPDDAMALLRLLGETAEKRPKRVNIRLTGC